MSLTILYEVGILMKVIVVSIIPIDYVSGIELTVVKQGDSLCSVMFNLFGVVAIGMVFRYYNDNFTLFTL